uniref:Uncharacterized protein n=1 Tax=Eptatretus burgeri TaxID=7764 RepID=A0A8C4WYK7_EPTBU
MSESGRVITKSLRSSRARAGPKIGNSKTPTGRANTADVIGENERRHGPSKAEVTVSAKTDENKTLDDNRWLELASKANQEMVDKERAIRESLQCELHAKTDLLQLREVEMAHICHNQYKLEQELAFQKLDTKFQPNQHLNLPVGMKRSSDCSKHQLEVMLGQINRENETIKHLQQHLTCVGQFTAGEQLKQEFGSLIVGKQQEDPGCGIICPTQVDWNLPKKQKDQVTQERDQLHLSRYWLIQERDELEYQVKQLVDQRDKVTEENDQLDRHRDRLKKQMELLVNQMNTIAQDRNQLCHERDQLKNEIDQLVHQKGREMLSVEGNELRHRIETQAEDRTQRAVNVAKSKDRNKMELGQERLVLETALEELRAATALGEENERLLQQMATLQLELAEVHQRLDAVQGMADSKLDPAEVFFLLRDLQRELRSSTTEEDGRGQLFQEEEEKYFTKSPTHELTPSMAELHHLAHGVVSAAQLGRNMAVAQARHAEQQRNNAEHRLSLCLQEMHTLQERANYTEDMAEHLEGEVQMILKQAKEMRGNDDTLQRQNVQLKTTKMVARDKPQPSGLLPMHPGSPAYNMFIIQEPALQNQPSDAPSLHEEDLTFEANHPSDKHEHGEACSGHFIGVEKQDEDYAQEEQDWHSTMCRHNSRRKVRHEGRTSTFTKPDSQGHVLSLLKELHQELELSKNQEEEDNRQRDCELSGFKTDFNVELECLEVTLCRRRAELRRCNRLLAHAHNDLEETRGKLNFYSCLGKKQYMGSG